MCPDIGLHMIDEVVSEFLESHRLAKRLFLGSWASGVLDQGFWFSAQG